VVGRDILTHASRLFLGGFDSSWRKP